MSYRYTSLLIGFILLSLVLPAVQAQRREEVTIGIVLDGGVNWAELIIEPLKNELAALLGSKYDIRIPPEKILRTDWLAKKANAIYDRLVSDRDVDVILGLGLLTGSVIAQKSTYPKPVIVLGILEPEVHGLSPTKKGTSGISNLTYLLFNRSLARELDAFYTVYPYRKIGIVFFDQLLKQVTFYNTAIRNVMEKNNTEYTLIPIENSVDEVLDVLDGIDSVYLGFVGRFEGEEKTRLIGELNARGIPTFGFSVNDVEMGVLAAMAPAYNFLKIFRRIALDIEAILEGADPANLPVHLSFEENLTLNMQTAREIGFSPKFTTLAEAELINIFDTKGSRVLNLRDVMSEAMTANLDLKIESGQVKSTEKDLALGRSNFFPSLTLGTTGTQIDQETAESSMGRQPEKKISGNARIDMVIFSEQSIGNIVTKKNLLRASEHGYDQLVLDVVLDAATAYFNVLRTQTAAKIQKENVDLTKTNLEIAKMRETVGYSGLADVYRWESRLASTTTDLLAAGNDVMLAKIQLNRLLNRRLNEPMTIQEASLDDEIFMRYRNRKIREHIDNPKSLQIYTDFLIEEAIRNSPQLKQLDANISGLERSLTSLKLQRFVPTVGLFAETQHVFYRGGSGSEVLGVDPVDTTWSVGINFNLPLFKGMSTSFNIQKTTTEIQKLRDQRAQLKQLIELGVRDALLEIIVKAVNLQSSRKSAEFANKSLELVQDAYSKGGVSLVDLADSQNSKLNAELAALNSVYEFLIAMLNVEKVVGKFALLSTAEEQEGYLQRLETYFRKSKKGD